MDKKRPSQGKEILFRRIEDEGILYQVQENRIHSLNSTALLIWELCDGEHSSEEIAARIVSVYKVEPEKALEDVATTLKQLEELGLLFF